MGHTSALHRPKYLHISPHFLSRPCLQQAVRQKNTFDKRISNAQRTPIIAHEKMLPGVNVIIAAYCHGSNERNCAYSNNSRHYNSTPKRTPVTNTYIKTYEYVMLSDATHHCHSGRRGTRPSNCALSNNERQHNCKEPTHTHSAQDQYITRCPSSLSQYTIV